jgi:hypothetical protein
MTADQHRRAHLRNLRITFALLLFACAANAATIAVLLWGHP